MSGEDVLRQIGMNLRVVSDKVRKGAAAERHTDCGDFGCEIPQLGHNAKNIMSLCF